MKILQLVQKPQRRGVEMFTAQLSSHINAAGHEAVLIFLFSGEAALPFDGTTYCLSGKPGQRFADFMAWQRLAQIIGKEKPDVIQANAGDTLKYAVFSRLLFRWKQPIVFRNASIISLYIKSRKAVRWNAQFFRYATKVISVSHTSAIDFGRLFPAHQNKISVIPVGIEDVPLSKTGNVVRERPLQQTTKGPVFIHVGGFTFEKNHEGLLAIFETILRHQPDASLHLVGDGPLRKKTGALVQQKGLAGKVLFYGFRTDVMPLIRAAAVLLLPSIIEGLPGVVLEAFLCRTPVVAFDVGGISEVVQNGRTGWLVKGGDHDSFALAALEAASDTPVNARLVQNAFELVRSRYLNRQIAQQFLSCYASLLSNGTEPHHTTRTTNGAAAMDDANNLVNENTVSGIAHH